MTLLKTDMSRVRKVLAILMESPLYFEMPLSERYSLLLHMLSRN